MTSRAFLLKISRKVTTCKQHIRNFILNMCIHILRDYDIRWRVYFWKFVNSHYIYIYMHNSPYIVCTVASHFVVWTFVLEHTLVTFMFELAINCDWVLNSPSPVTVWHRYCSTLVWIAWRHQVRTWPVLNGISIMANEAFPWNIISVGANNNDKLVRI